MESAEEAGRLFYVVNICTAEVVIAQDLTDESQLPCTERFAVLYMQG